MAAPPAGAIGTGEPVVSDDPARIAAALEAGECAVLVAVDPVALADDLRSFGPEVRGRVAGFVGDPAEPAVIEAARSMALEIFERRGPGAPADRAGTPRAGQ